MKKTKSQKKREKIIKQKQRLRALEASENQFVIEAVNGIGAPNVTQQAFVTTGVVPCLGAQPTGLANVFDLQLTIGRDIVL